MTLSAAQVEARRHGVGGSEILAALGKDHRCSRLELYKRKLGELPELDLSDVERVHFGNLLEPVIRDEFARRRGVDIIVPQQTLQHPDAPLVGNPDGWMPALGEGLEIKTCDKFEASEFGEEDSDQVPPRYLVQCSAYMALTDAPRWHLAVLIGGNELRTYVIERDPAIESFVLDGVRQFWSHVDRRVPPDPETPEDIKLRWPKDVGATVTATPEIESACYELRAAKDALKAAQAAEAEVSGRVKLFMQDAAQLVTRDGVLLATWRSNKTGQHFDEKRFAADHPHLYATYLQERAGARPLLLKVK